MGEIRHAALPFAWRIAAGTALWISVALLAWVLAHWGWYWFGPAPASIPLAPPSSDLARRIGEARLFGAARDAGNPATVEPSSNIGELRLLGVFSQSGGRGLALFRTPRGPLLVSTGQELGAGVRLEAVRRDGVTLRDGGVARELALRPLQAIDAKRASAQPAQKTSACATPPGFTGQIVRLNAELLGGMINTPDAWKTLLQTGAGALIVRDQSGFAGMLGLRNGDRIERANGISLALPEDIAATVLQPLTRSQPVIVAGVREGQPRQWFYLNAGACPG